MLNVFCSVGELYHDSIMIILITASLSPVYLCGSALHWSQLNSDKNTSFSLFCVTLQRWKRKPELHETERKTGNQNEIRARILQSPGVSPRHPSTTFLIAVCLCSYNLISIGPLRSQSLWTARDHGTCACIRPVAAVIGPVFHHILPAVVSSQSQSN